MAVNDRSAGYKIMEDKGSWDLISDLLGGTKAMRSAGEKWLPKETDEKTDNYNTRRNRSFLYNGFKDTITKCTARPFSRPVTYKVPEQLEEPMKPIIENMDGEGQHFQDFAREFFYTLVTWGITHGFVDYPKVPDKEGVTKKDEQDLQLRPINRIIRAPKLIGWKTEKGVNGIPKVVEIRILEYVIEENEKWEQVRIEQIRVVKEGGYTIYRLDEKGKDWKVYDEGEMSVNGVKRLPLVTAYIEKQDLMIAFPPLLELAWANLEHWQSLSDQKNILRFSRFGILLATGFTPEEVENGLTVAPTQAIFSTNKDAKLMFVEHTGQAVEAGENDIHSIEERMEVLGVQPMIQRLANVKATGQAINESKSRSQIESWVDSANRALEQILALNANWMGFPSTPDDFEVNIFQDFVFGTQTTQDIKDLIETRKLGEISHETFIKELQRYGRLSDDVDPQTELEKIGVEGPPAVQMFGQGQQRTQTTIGQGI
jgi:hypothetical protein